MAANPPSIICDDSIIEGDIVVGSANVISPKCSIIVSDPGGSIVIGDGNVFEENVKIVHAGDGEMKIGDNNMFQVGCVFEGPYIGSGSTIEAGAHVHSTASIGSNCVLGAKCTTSTALPDNTVVFGTAHTRRVQTRSNRLQANLHARHLEYLREVLPKYHHMRSD
ncbi:Dynactin subunit 6 [Geranomyces variabilis]|nr:Dynactin subunit 6 [Geranomyces variabilis]